MYLLEYDNHGRAPICVCVFMSFFAPVQGLVQDTTIKYHAPNDHVEIQGAAYRLIVHPILLAYV